MRPPPPPPPVTGSCSSGSCSSASHSLSLWLDQVRCTKGGKSGKKKTCAVHENGVHTTKECWQYDITAWYYKAAGCVGPCPAIQNTNDVCLEVYNLTEGATAEDITNTMMSVNDALAPQKRATFVNLGTILAIDEAAVQQCDLPSFKVNYPCYLADLTNVTEEQLSAQAGYQPNRYLHFGMPDPAHGQVGFPSINGQFYGNSGFARHDGARSTGNPRTHARNTYLSPCSRLQSRTQTPSGQMITCWSPRANTACRCLTAALTFATH